MGNTDSVVVQKRLARFRPEERPLVEGVFERLHGLNPAGVAGKAGKVLTLEMLKSRMGDIASDSMIKRVYAGMCSLDPGGAPPPHGAGVSREQLVVFLADVLRGTAEERAPLIAAMASGTGVATYDQIVEFLVDLVSAVVEMVVQKGLLQGWKPQCMGDGTVGVKLLAEQLSSELKPSEQRACDVTRLEDWLLRVPNVAMYMELLVGQGLSVGLDGLPASLLPPCLDAPWDKLRCLLDLPLLMFLTPHLPDGHHTPWKLLFSTRLHGESFSKIVGSCRGSGPTVLLLKDTKGHVFGGFASHSWEVKPQFQGDSRCLLFSVFPCLRVYTCTGYNQHYMYLNQGQQTMPNGLGMGGQHGYFGLWLDSDFGRGHSRARPRCTTYGSPQLSAEEDFTIETLEVWGVRKTPEEEEGETGGKRSILDADPEAQAMLEMTGKTLHSQGFREPEEDES